MDRYSLHRNIYTVSYLPKEIDSFFSLIYGLWVASVLGKQMVCVNFSIWLNVLRYIFIFAFLIMFYIFIAKAFYAAFRNGSYRAYGFIIWISILISYLFTIMHLQSTGTSAVQNAINYSFFIKGVLLILLIYLIPYIGITGTINFFKKAGKIKYLWGIIFVLSMLFLTYFLYSLFFIPYFGSLDIFFSYFINLDDPDKMYIFIMMWSVLILSFLRIIITEFLFYIGILEI